MLFPEGSIFFWNSKTCANQISGRKAAAGEFLEKDLIRRPTIGTKQSVQIILIGGVFSFKIGEMPKSFNSLKIYTPLVLFNEISCHDTDMPLRCW